MSLLVLFTIFAIFSAVLYLLVSKKPRETPPYTGGEIIPPSRLPHENFYQTFYALFPRTYRFLETLHDGNLDNYVFTILLTTALLLIFALLLGWLL